MAWNALNIAIMLLLLIRARGSGWRWREPALATDRLTRLQQRTARDLQAAVRLLLQRVQRLPGLAIGVDDVDALGDLAVGGARLAELKTLVAVDRRIAVAGPST